ncbi:MAG: PHP domain-containing protein [Chitinophagaceae bacterium]|nr:PHP domain-containing protein [Chitinophagaceae bacterium]
MDNYAIADNFLLLAKLIDIHGDNGFKAKSYASAAFIIEKLPAQLSTLQADKISELRGIGASIGKKIIEQLHSGRLQELDTYIIKTPVGLFEMLKIKGLGPKKIATVWKELEIESIGELLYACNENRLMLYKGFGGKTQQNIKTSIEFYLNNQGHYLFSQIEVFANAFTKRLESELNYTFLLTGDFRRQAEVIHKLEWVTDIDQQSLVTYLTANEYTIEEKEGLIEAKGSENVAMHFYFTEAVHLYVKLFETTGSHEFMHAWHEAYPNSINSNVTKEEQVFLNNQVAFVPPYLREQASIINIARANAIPQVVNVCDIRGIIHTHSNWSDGSNTIEEMARGAMDKGFEYLVISDHSKSAFYANGLYPDRIKAQHQLIRELNEELAPFKIFRSIESDILNDGSLDYDDMVLSSFDLVIASVHSNLKMNEEKAMARLLAAIANPYTTILGHMTGRLLLSRNGYPVDYTTIIEACAKHKVVIELNAHPRRLDMNWRHIEQATSKGVLISIDPDAHQVDAFKDIRYGVLAAQKGGLTSQQNLSSFTLKQFEYFLLKQQAKRR